MAKAPRALIAIAQRHPMAFLFRRGHIPFFDKIIKGL
jgi:hypothetical protein